MVITLNGKKVELEKEICIIDLLRLKGLEPARVVVEYNYEIVERGGWGSIVLKENDNIEVLKFVGGG